MDSEPLYYYEEVLKVYHHELLQYYLFGVYLFCLYFCQVTFNFRKMKNPMFWRNIGVLDEICMYDFYSGEPRPKDSASTTESFEPSFVNDRKYLIYTSPSANQPRNQIVLDKQPFFSIKPHVVFKDADINSWLNSTREAVYFPDGSHIYVYDCGDKIAKYFKYAYGAGLHNYRLGVQTNYDKTLSRDLYRHSKTNTNVERSLDPRHAVCILVNKESIADIKSKSTQAEPPESLSPYNFRPHLVISATPEYREDKIKALRIGTAQFAEALPCVIDQKVNYNSVSKDMSTVNEPYSALVENRKLKDVYPTISTTLEAPVFGLNLIVSKHGKFKPNDKVYAVY